MLAQLVSSLMHNNVGQYIFVFELYFVSLICFIIYGYRKQLGKGKKKRMFRFSYLFALHASQLVSMYHSCLMRSCILYLTSDLFSLFGDSYLIMRQVQSVLTGILLGLVFCIDHQYCCKGTKLLLGWQLNVIFSIEQCKILILNISMITTYISLHF